MYSSSGSTGFEGSIRCDGGAGRCEGSGCAAADGGIGDVYFNKLSGASAEATTDLVVRGHWVGLFPPQKGYNTITVAPSANLTWAPLVVVKASRIDVKDKGAMSAHVAHFRALDSGTLDTLDVQHSGVLHAGF